MKYSFTLAALAAASAAIASPVIKRAAAITNADILNYALTLEYLEDKFYREGLANYTQADFVAAGFADPFYDNLMKISSDETTHVKFLTSALSAVGTTPVAECTYSFPATDPKSFVMLASVLEGVGVSAYLGAAASICTYLPDQRNHLHILTMLFHSHQRVPHSRRIHPYCRGRHSSYLRATQALCPFPQPFDDPLDFNEVYTLAAPFIVSCPTSNPALPVKAFPALTLGTTGTIKAGSTITLLTDGYKLVAADGKTPVYAAFITATGPIYVDATAVSGGFSLAVPEGVNGQSYVVLTGCKDAVSDDTVAAGPAIVEITNQMFG